MYIILGYNETSAMRMHLKEYLYVYFIYLFISFVILIAVILFIMLSYIYIILSHAKHNRRKIRIIKITLLRI